MSVSVPALVLEGAAERFVRGAVERRDPGPRDIVIEIAYAGICHSDIHAGRGEWGDIFTFPLTPGHEITGTVAAIGSEVTSRAVGDRVGVGCFVDSCGECAPCSAGEQQYCERGTVFTYGSQGRDGVNTQGGYSTSIVVDERYVLGIPDALPLDQAAPLLCAGVTLYAPLTRFGAGPGKKVAIVGLGGLGHMGVKIAHALGAEVTVISRTLAKREDALRLGAVDYLASSDPEALAAAAERFDLIVNTVSAPIDVDAIAGLVRLGGAIVFVGMPPEPLSFDVYSLTSKRRILAGSNIGGIPETQEMLEFCARNELGADIEIVTADEVSDTWDRVVAGDVRYRAVIDIASLS
ncbi:NAD(P)-dependent alcohol dehydrogenase [Microbacterium enclense]|uniref:NAD(P)-dependent alcohol dehydrogenase n=1 Tax=Microbacterium enclense TaxID=993073 RepID=UPI0021A8CA57|nr:NAD(P)-dependent alcohol dehydrogenase [Microbacterium enclense]MCT2085159.1 NAD(P)-dependent alcohol dehydrogenase [Microbacterium enclense]